MSKPPRGGAATRAPRKLALVLLCGVAIDLMAGAHAWSQPLPGADDEAVTAFYLQAAVNGVEKDLIVRVDRRAGVLYMAADELAELGIRIDDLPFDAGQQIALDAVPGLGYDYDAAAQRIVLHVPEGLLRPQRLGAEPAPLPPVQSGTGLVVNYAINLQTTRLSLDEQRAAQRKPSPLQGSGTHGPQPLLGEQAFSDSYDRLNRTLSLSSELRFYSPIGVFQNSGVTTLHEGQTAYLRQDTYWTYQDPRRLMSYTVGDFVSAALPWSRAVRMGGISVAHNFDTRPDLVTYPVPSLGGSAVVPTTVDLYLNGLRQFSAQSSGGPFVIATPPALTGAGTATLVYRDQLGREVIVNRPLYVDSRLLAKGLSEYAVQAGYARRNYGSLSFDYAGSPTATASGRYGVTDAVTVEAHAEAASGLRNAGIGGLVQLGQFGVVNAAFSGSTGDASGMQFSGGYQYISRTFSFTLQGIHAANQYRDLGTLEGVPVPKQQLYVTLSVPVTARQTLSVSYSRQDASFLGGSRIVSVGYTASIGSRFNIFANVFKDYDQRQTVGAFIGVTVSLGNNVSVGTNASSYDGRKSVSVTANRPVDYDKGGFGWNVQADAGSESYRRGLGRVDYRGRYGDVTAQAEHIHSGNIESNHVSLYGAGSLVVADGAVLAGRSIYDAFAVVSTDGMPDVPVLRENRLVGKTNAGGRLLVPDLLPYDGNRIAISTLGLPAEASVTTDRQVVVPPTRAGVTVRFPVTRYEGATVLLVDAQGQPLPVGAHVVLEGSDATAVVGYDGAVFLPALRPDNRVTVTFGDRACTARVPYTPRDVMTTIGPFPCVLREQP